MISDDQQGDRDRCPDCGAAPDEDHRAPHQVATFKTILTGPDAQGVLLSDYDGQRVTVIGPLDPALYDADETGPMSVVQADDGTTFHAFNDELEPA